MSTLTIGAGASLTLDASSSYQPVKFLGPGSLTVTQDAGTPPGDVVVASVAAISSQGPTPSFHVSNGATLKVGSFTGFGLRPQFDVGSNGTLDLGPGINTTAGVSVNFSGPGTLVIDSGVNTRSIAGISGFGPNNTIDFRTLATSYAFIAGTAGKPGTLSLIQNNRSVGKISLPGAYTSSDFKLAADGHGGTTVSFACFLRGTRLDTPNGEIAVEDLRPGDLVLTERNGAVPVKWIGKRALLPGHNLRPEAVLPVRVRAGAIADGVPRRDLLLSPDHGLYLGGGLIPVKLVENGVTIVQETTAPAGSRFTYFHIELETHDILLAEATPAESYLDTGNRAVFENSGFVLTLHPDFTPRRWETDGAASLTLSGPLLEGVRESLLQRAESLAGRLTDDAGLHVVADGRVIPPTVMDQTGAQFVIPPKMREVRIVSRAAIAAQVLPSAYADRRRLGVAIDRVLLRHNGQLRRIAVDDPSLADGFHRPERDGGRLWRWTDGDAVFPAACYQGIEGVFILDIGLHSTLRYRLEPNEELGSAPVSQAA